MGQIRSGRKLGMKYSVVLLIALTGCGAWEEVKETFSSLTQKDSPAATEIPTSNPDAEDPGTDLGPAPDDDPIEPDPGASPDDGSDSEPDVDWEPEPILPEAPAPAAPGELSLDPNQLRMAIEGTALTRELKAFGGVAPYLFAMIGGTLPPGLSFDPETATVSGTPSKTGQYKVDFTVQDSSDPVQALDVSFSIAVVARQTQQIEFVTGSVGAASADLGLARGLRATIIRDEGLGYAHELDWSDLHYAAGISVQAVVGDSTYGGLGLAQVVEDSLMPRTTMYFDIAYELDGWIWVETPGALTLRLVDVNDAATLEFDGERIMHVESTKAVTTSLPDVKRGFHRIRLLAYNERGSCDFRLEMAEGGSDAPAPIKAERLFHGPCVMDIPLLPVVATADRFYRHTVKLGGTVDSSTMSIVDGALPAGLQLSSDGTIEGHPTESGTYYFTVRTSSPGGVDSIRRLAVHVLAPVPSESRNTEEDLLLTFDGSYENAPGVSLSPVNPDSKRLLVGAGLLGFKPQWPILSGGAYGVSDTIGVFGSTGSLLLEQEEVGFNFTGDQDEHLSDYFPAARTANRFSIYFRMPQRAVREGVNGELDWSKDPARYLRHVLTKVHMAGHNGFRWEGHSKEQNNWHFYHKLSNYWPDYWKSGVCVYVGNGWFYFESGDQQQSQRTGKGDLVGFYNPIRDYDRNYFATLSRFYFTVNEGRGGVTKNTYSHNRFHYDNFRLTRKETQCFARTHDGEKALRVKIGADEVERELPFRFTYTGDHPVRFRISQYRPKVPSFNGDGLYEDLNGNGRIDETDRSLAGQTRTSTFSPGETRNFIYKLNVSKAATDTTILSGISFRIMDPKDVYSLDGDSIMFLLHKATDPSRVARENIYVSATSTSDLSTTAPANVGPKLTITTLPKEAKVGQEIRIAGTASDPDGPRQPRPYWDTGDATPYKIGAEATHVYKHPGVYTVRMHATDGVKRSTVTAQITVTE